MVRAASLLWLVRMPTSPNLCVLQSLLWLPAPRALLCQTLWNLTLPVCRLIFNQKLRDFCASFCSTFSSLKPHTFQPLGTLNSNLCFLLQLPAPTPARWDHCSLGSTVCTGFRECQGCPEIESWRRTGTPSHMCPSSGVRALPCHQA